MRKLGARVCAAAALLVNSPVSIGAESAAEDSDEIVARNAVRLFFEGWIKIYPDPERFARWIAQNELPPIPSPQDKSFLQDKPGKAWVVDNKGIQYALAAQDDNLCSVFVKFVSPADARRQLQPMLNAILKPQVREARRTYVEEREDGPVTTRTYVYKMTNGRWLMTISISTSDSTDGPYQLALNAMTSMRIGKPAPTK